MESKHRGHEFEQIDKVYNKHKSKILQQMEIINKR